MAKEILLYSFMYDYSIAQIMRDIEAAKNQKIRLRINTGGGDVLDSYGLVAKLKELTMAPELMVDGQAASMGAFLCCYFDQVKALDVSEFTFHRAAYPSYIEGNAMYFTEPMRQALIKTNADLRAAMEGKIKASDWKRVTGVSFDDLFSLDERIDVTINARQAKDLGLISEIIEITPEKKAEIQGKMFAIAAAHTKLEVPEQSKEDLTKTNNKMTIEQLKAEHPALYAAAVKEGVTKERDRVGSYLTFIQLDPEGVKKGIQSGEDLSATAMSEFSLKAFTKNTLQAAETDNAEAVSTGEVEPEKPAKEKAVEAFKKDVRSRMGLK